jgi:hypothetical protein
MQTDPYYMPRQPGAEDPIWLEYLGPIKNLVWSTVIGTVWHYNRHCLALFDTVGHTFSGTSSSATGDTHVVPKPGVIA